MKKKFKKAKWLSKEALQIFVKRREAKSKGEKEKYKHLTAEFQRIARRDRKPSSAINAKKQRKTQNGKNQRSLKENQRHQGKKQESSRKTSISALLTMPKPLTVWITRKCGKF